MTVASAAEFSPHRPRRVAILAPPWLPIPPLGYGGIEQVVALQARLLAESGDEVTLVAAPGTRMDGVDVVIPLTECPDLIGERDPEWRHVLDAADAVRGHDVVIDHSGPLAGLALAGNDQPILHVTHGELTPDAQHIYRGVASRSRTLRYVAISEAQRRSAPTLPFAGVAHNALDTSGIGFSSRGTGYLTFLGRMAPEKGPAEAIAVAQAAGRPLLIAAKCSEPPEIAYFERHVRPKLGPNVVWLGELGETEKYQLLRDADALLFPISWPEPFGMVMVEAMASGTPVLATSRGSVPEVVRDGVTGFIRERAHELVECVHRLDEIDRRACRDHVEMSFGPEGFVARWGTLIDAALATREQPQRTREKRVPLQSLTVSLDRRPVSGQTVRRGTSARRARSTPQAATE